MDWRIVSSYASLLTRINPSSDSPNSLNGGYPQQASQDTGRGFFTAPGRKTSGNLIRKRPSTFSDHWTQPRLFYNSLSAVEQQFLIDAIRFETSHIGPAIQRNVLAQLNKVSHDIAIRVATAIGLEAPEADDKYYHDNTTAGISILNEKLPTIATLRVGVLASTSSEESLSQAKALKEAFANDKVTVITVAETLGEGVNLTYSQADAINFDGIIVAEGTNDLFNATVKSTLYPPRRPAQILADGYNWGKPVGFLGGADAVLATIDATEGEGVYTIAGVDEIVEKFRDGLATFKFTDRFAIDE